MRVCVHACGLRTLSSVLLTEEVMLFYCACVYVCVSCFLICHVAFDFFIFFFGCDPAVFLARGEGVKCHCWEQSGWLKEIIRGEGWGERDKFLFVDINN